MKTTDLIPIILYQLKDGDRYGYEIIKQIEDSSQGKISIKQPTLYSVLKKLEQNKFITSYWMDSEIGGKRHYYKLTDNGISQLSTYPALHQLISDALNEDIGNTDSEDVSASTISKENVVYTPDAELITNQVTNSIKIDLTSPTGFANNDTDNLYQTINNDGFTNTESTDSSNIFEAIEPTINIDSYTESVNIFDMMEPSNTTSQSPSIFDAIDSNDNSNLETPLYDNESTTQPIEYENTTFQDDIQDGVELAQLDSIDNNSILTEKVDANPDVFVDTDYSNLENLEAEQNNSPIEQVKYLNYVDFSTSEKSVNRRRMLSKHIQKMSFTCLTLLLMIISTLIICSKYSFGKIYYIGVIISVLIVILYPILLINDLSKLRFKYCTNPFKYSLIQDVFIKLSSFLSLTIATFAYNISNTSSIANMFNISNFANLYAPIIFASIFIFDLLYSILLYKEYRIKK